LLLFACNKLTEKVQKLKKQSGVLKSIKAENGYTISLRVSPVGIALREKFTADALVRGLN